MAAAAWISASAQKAPAASAAERDVVGPTYPITEPDMVAEIQAKLRAMQANGKLQEKVDEAKRRATRTAHYPKPVAGLGRSAVSRTYYFDPSIRANQDIKDAAGKVVVQAGATVNPLDYVTLNEWLVFFDASDPRQVAAAEALGKRYDWMVKPILVNGGPLDLMRRWKRRVYFDQGGTLVRQLGIQNVPALVTQEGKGLRIDELVY